MFEIYDVAIIPLILALVELFKRGGVPVKYSPFIAVVFGLLFGMFYLDVPVKESVLVGLMIGLSASGLYSGAKNLLDKEGDKH